MPIIAAMGGSVKKESKSTPKGFFVTGTDTGVGKTVVSALLLKFLQAKGLKPCGMKPVETGCGREGRLLVPSDGFFLKEISGANENIDLITPFRFHHPLAPLAAGRIEGGRVEPGKIFAAFNYLRKKYDAVVAEGIGGLLVPLNENYSVLDMAREMGLPVIVVARPGLGTINHTLLTVNYAIGKGLEVAGVVINHSGRPEENLAENTNPEMINELCPVPLIGTVPHLPELSAQSLEDCAKKLFDSKGYFV